MRQRRRAFHSRTQLESYQSQRLQKLMAYVQPRSPFYAGHSGQPIDKAMMMANFDRLNTRGLSRERALSVAIEAERSRDFAPMLGGITVGLSSGTSGHRGLFCADFFERCAYAGTILAKALPPGEWKRKQRVAFFLRANSNLYQSVRSSRLQFHFFDLLKPLESHLSDLHELEPTILIGPPSLLRQLAEQILTRNWPPPKLRRLYSVAEVLDPLDQRRIEQAFALPVHQIYQCTEGFLGISCAHGQMHLNEDLLIFEKEWVDREAGKFVPILTDLSRRTQPIIRYRLNDILTEDPEPCACGSVFTRLKMIEGRCDDILYFRDRAGERRAIFPDFVRHAVLYASDQIHEYQVQQTHDGELAVALSTPPAVRAEIERQVQTELVQLAERLNCAPPGIRFVAYEAPAPGQKLRRITRRALDAHLQ
jgi:putative adenylate-forming enzyme